MRLSTDVIKYLTTVGATICDDDAIVEPGDNVFRIDRGEHSYSVHRYLHPNVNRHETALIAEDMADVALAFDLILSFAEQN